MLRATMRTPRDRRQAAWFFRTHDREELARWTASLRFFRFVRAIGGHAKAVQDCFGDFRVLARRIAHDCGVALPS